MYSNSAMTPSIKSALLLVCFRSCRSKQRRSHVTSETSETATARQVCAYHLVRSMPASVSAANSYQSRHV